MRTIRAYALYVISANRSRRPFTWPTDRASAQLCWPLEMDITSRFINNIICRRRVPLLIGSGGKLVKGIDGNGEKSLNGISYC